MTYPNLIVEEMRPGTFLAFKAWLGEHAPAPGHSFGIVTSDPRGFFVREEADVFAERPFGDLEGFGDWISVFDHDGRGVPTGQVAFFSNEGERPVVGGRGYPAGRVRA